MKQGPVALIAADLPVIVLAQGAESFARVLSDPEELKSRHGIVVAFTDGAGKDPGTKADSQFSVPRTNPFLPSFLLPLPLFTCQLADARGYDVYKRRNLAKGAKVELPRPPWDWSAGKA